MTDDQNFNLELDEMNEMDFYEGKEDSDVDILVESVALEDLTLMKAMEWLDKSSRDTKLSDEYLERNAQAIQYVADKFALTPRQAVLLSIFCVRTSGGEGCSINNVAERIGWSNFDMLINKKEFQVIEKRHLIRREPFGTYYRISDEVKNALVNNSELLPVKYEGLSFEKFFFYVYKILKNATEFDYDTMSSESEMNIITMIDDIKQLMDDNPQLEFVKAFKNAPIRDRNDFLLFMICANQLVNWDYKTVVLQRCGLNKIINDSYQFGRLRHALLNGNDLLVSDGLIRVKHNAEEGDLVTITPKAMEQYFKEYESLPVPENNLLLKPEEIVEKTMIYNPEEGEQISRLANILDKKNFHNVCCRLKNAGIRRGICVLFSGGPGTGKTETVLQLARQSGRPILQVNVNDVMDKYVGESEKRMVRVFDNYRRIIKKSLQTPILFFNECDQLFSKRLEKIERRTDAMHNSLQNILLQQMETFEGILICTTNLVQNLDAAFERRFLFKVDFQKPSKEARFSIWKSMLPFLADDEINTLSETYDFSGGQIENIRRKVIIEMSLTGIEKPTLEECIGYCNKENIRKTNRIKIGF